MTTFQEYIDKNLDHIRNLSDEEYGNPLEWIHYEILTPYQKIAETIKEQLTWLNRDREKWDPQCTGLASDWQQANKIIEGAIKMWSAIFDGLEKGDRVYWYSSPDDHWKHMHGSAGFIIFDKDGKIKDLAELILN